MISVIIPVYNAENYISDCIESVLNQTYTNFELILVDDGSRDKSYEICKNYALKDNRIILIKKENGGVSSARYQGLISANGEYITFVDNDDLLLPSFLEKILNLADKEVDVVVITAKQILFDNVVKDKIFLINQPEICTDKYTGNEAVEEIVKSSQYSMSKALWGKLYRKQFFVELHLEQYKNQLSQIFMEDVFAMDMILLSARKVKFCNEILYIRRIIADSLSKSGALNKFFFEQIYSYDILYKFLKDRNVYFAVNHCLDNYDKCLQRLWYRIKHDKKDYMNAEKMLMDIKKLHNQYYNDFLKMDVSKIRKINLVLFRYAKKIWEFSFGLLYFGVFSKYNKKKYFKALQEHVE